MRLWGLLACAALFLPLAPARADIPDDTVKIGIVVGAGPEVMRTSFGAMAAAQMAAQDFEARSFKLDAELHEFDADLPDLAPVTVEDWLKREKIDVLIDVAGSADAVNVAREMQARHRLFVAADLGGPGMAKALQGPDTLIWGVDPAALGRSVVDVLMGKGLKSWFFISGHGPLQQALSTEAARTVLAGGGTVAGMYTHPMGLRDFEPDMRQADQSQAQVVAISEVGPELNDAVTETAWTGVAVRHQVAALFAPLGAIDQIGLQAAQGMVVAEPFYWNRNHASRDFSARFAHAERGRMPTATEAIVYSATIAVLHAAAAADSVEGDKVVAALRRGPIPDDLLGRIMVQPDGVAQHDMYVFRVKRPGESRQRWDDLTPIATVPAATAFRLAPPAHLPPERTVAGPSTAGLASMGKISGAPAAPGAHLAPHQIPTAPAATSP